MESKLKGKAAFQRRVKTPKLEGVSEAFAVTAEEALIGYYRSAAKKRAKKAGKRKKGWSCILPGSFESNSR